MERSQRSGRVVSIGIAPWGIVENNHELIGHNKDDVPYHSISSPRSKFAVLNNRHAYFLLVDNGTAGKYGAEIILRRKLEKYISNQKLHPGTHCSTPVVCLVIEGGTNTIRAVLEYVTDTPPVPVVVCDGSGRAADLLAFTHKYASEDGEQTVLENMKEYLISTIQRTFEVAQEQAECLYVELLECTRKKNLITVFRISDRTGGEGNVQELDQTILTALFKSQHLSPSEQLSLALTWNRVDIARSEIFVYGQEWPPGALDEAMMQALEHDRIDFVKLLLENGVSMRKFLTIPRLEELYNTKQGPSNTMGFILRDVRPHIPRGYMYTLHDIGLVINKLMGGAYRASYTRRKFRLIYAKVMKKSPNFHRNSASFIKYYGNTNLTLSLLAGTMPTSETMHMFEYPFNELLIWAVLTKRQEMALLMWQHGEEALAKSLVGCKLYKAMAHEAAEDDLETEIYEELRSYGKVFEDIALELLDFCYRQDDDQTQQLLTCELQNWSGQTCLSLAVAANHRPLLAHPCSQIILADLWMGGLRTRKHTNVKRGWAPGRLKRKLYEFYTAPITKFYAHSIAYLIFLITFSYVVLVKMDTTPSIQELYVISYIATLGCEKVREIISSEPVAISHKFSVWAWNMWNPCDAAAIIFFMIGLSLRIKPSSMPVGRVIFCVDIIYWYLRILNIVGVNKYLGPLVTMMGKMVKNMIYFVVLLLVVLMSFGVCRQSILFPDSEPSWSLAREVFFQPYFMLYGEVFADKIYPPECDDGPNSETKCVAGRWVPPLVMSVYLLVSNILLVNLLIAVFNNIFMEINSISHQLNIRRRRQSSSSVSNGAELHSDILAPSAIIPRQLSQTHSEPDSSVEPHTLAKAFVERSVTWAEPRIKVIPPPAPPARSMLMAMHTEYTRPTQDFSWVFADEIDPPCGDSPGQEPCHPGRWITPLVMSTYLLVANILLINLLIAVFNNIFIEVNAISHQVWMFQRFTVVMEYEQKPALPPPFIILSHILLFIKYLRRKCEGVRETYDNGLKLFLDKEDLERLYDFEEECVEGYFREKETKLAMSTDERIRNTTERVENINQKVEDINQKENSQNSSIQALEFRLRKLEDLSEQTLSTLSVIHRYYLLICSSPITDELETVCGLLSPPRSPRLLSPPVPGEIPPPSAISGGPTARNFRRCRHASEMSNPEMAVYLEKEHLRDAEESDYHLMEEIIHTRFNNKEAGSDADKFDNNAFFLTVNEETASEIRANPLLYELSRRGHNVTEVSSFPPPPGVDNYTYVYVPHLFNGHKNCRLFLTHGGIHSAMEAGYHGVPVVMMPGFSDQFQNVLLMQEKGLGRVIDMDSLDSDVVVEAVNAVLGDKTLTLVLPRACHSHRYNLLTSGFSFSITDELETVCGLLSPPRSPRLLSPPVPGEIPPPSAISGGPTARNFRRCRHASEMSNPEMAVYLEKEHLRDAEESDYHLMEEIIHTRFNNKEAGSDADKFDNNAFFLTVNEETASEIRANTRSLRRSSAIEIGEMATPTTSRTPSMQSPSTSAPPEGVLGGEPKRKSSKTDSLTVPNSAETMC
ncbi:transient receptor potential cation channel trpm [Diaphorina citri]|uniref:Transient receptor potential cation channel trpm n=1 Tax=Diaphorina citri TaxID=121845 RepID=A0A1S4EBM1_DIACI|nr:transient receptor potential cation channel trpm [Diaphorina citri]